MSLSKRTIETLIDLVEIKLSSMEVWDREDKRAIRDLEACLKELSGGRRPARITDDPVSRAAH